jgi:hypothetical protein
LTAQAVQYPQAVALAVSFLVGDAAKYWHTHAKKLQAMGHDIYQWRTFKTALFERFGYKNAEHAARDRLSELHQGTMSFAQYVNAFDDCYAYIPEYDEADKIHRFLRGLRFNTRQKFCINPVTARRWTRYNAMVAYGHNLMNETSSAAPSGPAPGVIKDIAADAGTKRTSPHQQQGAGKKYRTDPSGGSAAPTTSRDTIPARDLPNSDEKEFTIIMANQQKVTFSRNKQLANYCMRRHLCAHCYRSGHSPNHCRFAKATGYPPNFDPNYKSKRRQ